MSLEDHHLTTVLDSVKTQTVPIADDEYIDYQLKEQGLSHEDADTKYEIENSRGYCSSMRLRTRLYYKKMGNDLVTSTTRARRTRS
eukprot:6277780-Amphidinium_carterae.1